LVQSKLAAADEHLPAVSANVGRKKKIFEEFDN